MKKLIALLLSLVFVLGLTACTQSNANDLMKGIPAKAVDALPDMNAGAAAAADFGVRLFQTSMEEGKNTLISPLSVLYGLAMTANGADGETLAQMEQVLGMDSEDLNCYMLAYLDLLPEAKEYKISLANSVWFKDDPNLVVEQNFLQTNADYYGASIYKAAFDEGTKNDINNWVKEHTDDLIPEIVDQIPEDAVMYLVNALAFEAEWDDIYEETQVWDSAFTSEDGTQQDVQMMHSEEHTYLEDEMATGFIKYYEGRKYAFAAMLPNEGVTVEQYVDSLTGSHLQEVLANPGDIMVLTTIPKFESGFDIEMSEVLQEMGMTDAFDWTAADFSRLGTYNADGVNICINRVLHKTFIAVAERGTKAGAATAVEMVGEGAIEMPEHKTVRLDRPFVYMLIDCETNLPFFIGTMMDVNGGCKAPEEMGQTNPPGSNEASKPTPKEPPVLKILDGTCHGIEANTGTYTWSYYNGDGTQSGVCADSSHPLQWQEFLVPMITSDDTLELHFSVEPQEFTVRCWSDACWGDGNAKEERVTLEGNTLQLKEGGYIYEVAARWTGENLAAEGTVSYGFYVIKDTHVHMTAEEPQTVDDPISGYCGNMITKIILDGKEYEFMSSDSVNLTDILINLKYDPNMICNCLTEFSVVTEDGTRYGVNLSEAFARCDDGQAALTEEQIELIRQILDNQT